MTEEKEESHDSDVENENSKNHENQGFVLNL